MHSCLCISEIQNQIFSYAAETSKSPLVALARTCRLFSEPALDMLWRELDDISPLVKCLPSELWTEEVSETDTGRTLTLTLRRPPTQREWEHLHHHVQRIRKFTFCSQWYTDSGESCRIAPATLALLSQHISARSRPFLPKLNILHFDFYERYPGLWIADCFSHIAGRSLEEVHLHCDEDTVPEGLPQHSLSLVLPALTKQSPFVSQVSIWDSRNYPTTKHCNGVSGLLTGLYGMQRFTCSLPIRNNDIASLSRLPKLTALSVALFMDRAEGPALPASIRNITGPAFRSLHTLVLQVAHVSLATAFVAFPQTETIRKLRIATPMWFDETDLQHCFKAVSAHRRLQELSIAVISTRIPAAGAHGHVPFGAQCTATAASLALLYPLADMRAFSLAAQDHALFETDLDDAGVEALARAWPALRSLSIVQGSWCPRGVTLPPARTTMRGLLALREHCPHLAGLSIGLDTTEFDTTVLHAAAVAATDADAQGDADSDAGSDAASSADGEGEGVLRPGYALRKLNIDTRSTPVSNTAIAAQILHGLFPVLKNIHDGSSVAWDAKRSDWQEVGGILRGMIDGVADVEDEGDGYEYMEEDTEQSA